MYFNIDLNDLGYGPGVVIKTHVSHAENLRSNPIPEIITYDFKSYSDGVLWKGSKVVGFKIN